MDGGIYIQNHKVKYLNFRHYGANIENRCNGKTDKEHQQKGINEGFTYGLEYYENTYSPHEFKTV